MITGRWGRPSQVLLDITSEPDGRVRGVVNPGRENVEIQDGHFHADTGAVHLKGEHRMPDGETRAFRIEGRLFGRMLRLSYSYGELAGTVEVVRVEEYRAPRPGLLDRVKPLAATVRRVYLGLGRPSPRTNRRRLRARGESLESIMMRDAVAADVPALAELHATTWNATYRTTRGPTAATRERQWAEVFEREGRRDFLLVLQDGDGRLIGFVWGRPSAGAFDGELSKIYLRWEYHGMGLGRRMMVEACRRFLGLGMRSFVLFADAANPTVGFYDHLGGERLLDDRGRFGGAFVWRDAETLLG